MEFTQSMRDEINARWNLMQVRPEKKGDVQWCANQIIKNKGRYEKVAAIVDYPWWFIAIIHGMECGFNFTKWLANGDPISAPTVRVPKGLTCDGTWEDAARVSIQHEWKSKQSLATIADVLWAFERYNGTGYRNRGKPSQYVWSFTNIEQPGRYVPAFERCPEHDIRVEKLSGPEGDYLWTCGAAEHKCPPEDCGGPWGYTDLLRMLGDPEHEEYEEYCEWVGQDFDPANCDLDNVNKSLRQV